MVDERNTILMTRLAIFEKHEKNKSLEVSKFFKSDYVRFQVLKTWVAVTVLYWSIVGGYVFMAFDVLLAKQNDLDYFGIMYKLLGGYVMLCGVYFLFATFLYKYRYEKAKVGLVEYNVNLKKLTGMDLKSQRGQVVTEDKMVEEPTPAGTRPRKASGQSSGQAKPAGESRATVKRTDMIQRQLDMEQQRKNEEILANVQKRNERIAASKEAEQRRQRQLEEERRRIRENRQRLEREQMERLRQQRMQQGAVRRENHVYTGENGEGRSDS